MALKTYGKLQYDQQSGKWEMLDPKPHVCIKLKALFASIPKSQAQLFEFANTPENCNDLIWFTDRYPMEISATDLIRLNNGKKSYLKRQSEIETILQPDYKPEPVQLNEGMAARDYQLKGMGLARWVRRILIGDDIGLGKTLTSILTLIPETTRPAIAVVQTHLPTQWEQEIRKFTNLRVYRINTTKPYSLPPADVYVFKYSNIASWIDVLLDQEFNYKTVIFDEIQELRRPGSQKYNACAQLSEVAENAIGLSATPIYNYGDEIFFILNLLNPGCLGDLSDFLREWCSHYDNRGAKVSDPEALGTYLRDNYLLLRRTRQEVGMELPPINNIIHTVDYDVEMLEKSHELTRQLAISVTSSGSFVERGMAARELNALLRLNTGVSKARHVAAYVRMIAENGEPVLLAGWHREVYDIWMEELREFNPVMYTGSESPTQKLAAKRDFVSGKSNIMIASLRSMIGLNGLQERCSINIMGELDWSPQVHDQVTGRLDRPGQIKQVTRIYLVSNYGADPVMMSRLGIKAFQSHGIINPLAGATQNYTDETRIKEMALFYLNKYKSANDLKNKNKE